jgi:hypothetical protein
MYYKNIVIIRIYKMYLITKLIAHNFIFRSVRDTNADIILTKKRKTKIMKLKLQY